MDAHYTAVGKPVGYLLATVDEEQLQLSRIEKLKIEAEINQGSWNASHRRKESGNGELEIRDLLDGNIAAGAYAAAAAAGRA